ncbi:cellulose synthase/poly-beta-1,6-N-acetylglucosamine synthase-like glycosyltransferase [Halopolyspora algeriensis]|uniref:Cellulose synthase/poly-beta-1,6-N-acetylglucosamine synthase-like glycosyltransferase n=1 Tax=Halopolyspora algeriensis TaxID=1500506 RepID=A0A368VR74_9ACTN|nr:cellulose synthase/poly-beta-1,6-N-acetylglucosamine synthase-like glycosyltransferase [Halopolyspora algeriensis]TQM55781.1 cellulose synthase/poly-beta-1,6-N-acetylglucosamine synthase-like glycosyltransferase [Halopolyspora algeriensis]
MIPWWLLAMFVVGTNFALWATVGLLRLLDGAVARHRASRRTSGGVHRLRKRAARGAAPARPGSLSVDDVAVLIAAHNEGPVIADSLRAVLEVVPRANVHVVSDGSTDDTFDVACRCGVRVIRTSTNLGKAGALQEAIERFRLVDRFEAVMLLDADTRVDPGYFRAALPLFDDPRIVAVAGCVRSDWCRSGLSAVGKLLVCHRQRIYALTQYLLKFGQTWRRVNATHIIPGFASLYRTEVLPHIEVNPPGLVIEDFNMTFEVYRKRLGKVGFTPSAVAVTQDPGTLGDYVRQTKRWALGLWQTVRRHRLRADLFSGMLVLLLLEQLTSSVLLVLLPLVLLLLVVPELLGAVLAVPEVAAIHGFVTTHVGFGTLLFGVVLPDLALTCAVALFLRRTRFLAFGALFPLLRILDAVIALYALPLVWLSTSTGRWRSPSRRELGAETISDTGSPASSDTDSPASAA